MATQELFNNSKTYQGSQFLSQESQIQLSYSSFAVIYSFGFLLILIWQCLNANYYNYELYQKLNLLFITGAASLFYYAYRPQNSQILFYIQTIFLGLIALVFLSTSTVFLLAAIMIVFLAAFAHGFQFSMGIAITLAGLMNFNFLLSSSVVGTFSWTPLIIFDGSLFVAGLAAGFLSDELRGVAGQLQNFKRDINKLQDISDKMIDKMASGILVVNSRGEILRSNPEACHIFEVKNFQDLFVEDLSLQLWSDLQSDRFGFEPFEIEHTTNSGQLMKLECYIMNLDDGSQSKMLFFQNRTKIKNIEEKLRQNEKLAAVGQLAAGIAHEIRNPLASISGSIQLLAGSIATESKEDKKLLAIVIKEIDRLDALITEFMEYVRPESSMKDNVNLSLLIEDCITYLQNNPASLGVVIDKKIQKSVHFRADQSKIQQALLNMFINACQAMDKEPKKLLIEMSADQDSIQLVIQDNGKGIPKDQVRKIFQPFHTTKPKGTGLGLAISHKIIESHHGEIQVESHIGEGTRFQIQFNLNKV